LDLLFYLRSVETSVAIFGLTLSIATIRPRAKYRLGLSCLFLLVLCGVFTFIYTDFHYSVSEKIFVPILVIVLGYLLLVNSSDSFAVNLFNFFTQYIIYSGVTMICSLALWTGDLKTDIIYLVIRAIIFALIILFEFKYVRKRFRYLVELTMFENSVWYAASLGVTLFTVLIISLSVYPVMYYDRSIYELIEIAIVYLLMIVIYYVFYIAIHATMQKRELIHSGKLMDEKLNTMEKYKQLSEIDMLTDVLNRRAFQERVQCSLKSNQAIAFMMIDIDNFKQINDNFGHDIGDHVIKMLATTLENSFRSYDNIGRMGGDEFAVLLNNGKMNKEQIMKKIVTFKQTLSQQIPDQETLLHFSVSIGIAYANDETDFDKLYKCADMALYEAKGKGKDCVVFYDE